MNSKLLTGVDSLLDNEQAYNALWSRSAAAYPGLRSENIALWMNHFESDCELKMVTVWDQDRMLAALPLYNKGSKFGLPFWSLTSNCWAASGDLLLDPDYSADDLCEQLVSALSPEKWSLLKFETIATESERWKTFLGVLKSNGHRLRESAGGPIALTDILQDWPAYQASWSGNHRAAVKKGIKRLKAAGDLQVECFRTGEHVELISILNECFDLEDRTWKGENGTSILKCEMQDFFLTEAHNLMNNDMLHLWQLRLDGKLIAFEYCPVAKGVVYSNKISFDPEYSRNSPGNVLRFYQHEHYQQDAQYQLFDMMGITCKNKSKWATRTYETGNVIAANGAIGSLSLAMGNKFKPPATEQEDVPPLGAARYLETASPSASVSDEASEATVATNV